MCLRTGWSKSPGIAGQLQNLEWKKKSQATQRLEFFPGYPMEGYDLDQIQGHHRIARKKSLALSSLWCSLPFGIIEFSSCTGTFWSSCIMKQGVEEFVNKQDAYISTLRCSQNAILFFKKLKSQIIVLKKLNIDFFSRNYLNKLK